MTSEQTSASMELASRVYGQPLAIGDGFLELLNWAKIDLDDLQKWMDSTGAGLKVGEGDQAPAGVSVIPVKGSLFRGTFFDDYAAIGAAFDDALADSEVGTIVLEVDSPGGSVTGLFDLAEKIYAGRESKRIVAIADDQMTSAAYAIASSAHEVVASPTSTVGSIGVVAVHVDASEQNKKAGVKLTEITSGKKKTALSQNSPLSSLGRDLIQKAVDTSAERFHTLVARNRNLSVEAVKAQEAGVFFGSEAVTAGLADRVAGRSELMLELTDENQLSTEKIFSAESLPQTQTETEVSEMASDETTIEAETEPHVGELAEAGSSAQAGEVTEEDSHTNEIDVDEIRAEAQASAVEIVELCSLAGVPAEAAQFIASGADVESVRKSLIEGAATRAELSEIANRVDPNASADEAVIDASQIYRNRARR